MRPYNRYIKYNLKYFILKQFELYAKYIFINYIFYLLIITETDWRRVRTKKKNFKRAFIFKKKKLAKRQRKITDAFLKMSRLRKSFFKVKY